MSRRVVCCGQKKKGDGGRKCSIYAYEESLGQALLTNIYLQAPGPMVMHMSMSTFISNDFNFLEINIP